jgi:hypothetical protein
MYGVPQNLDLQRFHGDSLMELGIGQCILQFRFAAGLTISVEGGWLQRDATGIILDRGTRQTARRECDKLQLLVGATVTTSSVDPPSSFTLYFDNGMSLTVFDDSYRYESCSIQPGDIFI